MEPGGTPSNVRSRVVRLMLRASCESVEELRLRGLEKFADSTTVDVVRHGARRVQRGCAARRGCARRLRLESGLSIGWLWRV
jgi:hypothetical protein